MEERNTGAFGWPSGTVRGMLAIGLVALSSVAALFLTAMLAVNEQYTEAVAVLGLLMTQSAGVIGYYFGKSQ